MTPVEFAKERKKLVAEVKKKIAPFFRNSGYVKDNRPLKIWVPRDMKGEPTHKTYKLQNGFVVQELEGFTEDGVITDSYGGGLSTVYWCGMPIEDLFRLNAWMDRMLPKLTAYDQMKKSQAKSARRISAGTASQSAAR